MYPGASSSLRHNIVLLRHGKVLTEYDPKPAISIATLSYEYPAHYQVPEHAHGSDQLIYAISGVMQVFSGQSMWLIPPQFALWIPARTQHRIDMARAVSMRTLYIRRGLVTALPSRCAVLHVTPLLRELIVETVCVRQLRMRNRLQRALSDLVISRIEQATPVPIFVTLPREPRALAVAESVLNNPAQSETLTKLCARVGVSVRTLQRIFRTDVGTGFESWRRQARLTKAVELLVGGASVKEVAFAVGYRQSSAFVELFRRTFGATPKAWAVSLHNRRDLSK
jgi:AraC-like DNA-binding protein/mannose-6-phosphate isomerase-like protein (cupin superfamily)